jgi:hypothetical protein
MSTTTNPPRNNAPPTPAQDAPQGQPRMRPRGRPFPTGNPGRPKGAKHKVTRAAEALLDGEAEVLTRKAVELALKGDGLALRLCLERILPPRKERPLEIDLPPVDGAAGILAASAALVAAAAAGEVTPGEARELGRLLEAHLRAVELHDLEARLAALEAKEQRT